MDFYAPLLAFLDARSPRFSGQATRDMLLDAPMPSQLLDALEAEQAEYEQSEYKFMLVSACAYS